MQAPAALFRFVARSVHDAVGAADGGALLDNLPRLADVVWDAWSRTGTAAERRIEILTLARAPADAIAPLAREIAAAAALDRSPEFSARLATYLTLIPRLIRRWLSRVEDPRGLSMPPALSPFHAADILPLLPVRLPRFRPGDRPFPGVDRELVALLGAGPSAETWLARDTSTPSAPQMVLKFYHDAATKKRLLGPQNAILLQVLQPGRISGVVSLRRTYLAADPPCLEFEYVGGDVAGLAYQLHHEHAPVDAFHRLLQRVAKTLGACHRLAPPIVHNNLKPSNILLQPRDDRRVSLRIGDFAFADARPPNPRDDVFALGVLWCQMLLGEMAKDLPPRAVWRPRLLALGVTVPVLDVLLTCLDEDSSRRCADAAELAERIEAAVRQPAAPAPQASVAAQPAPTATASSIATAPAARPEEPTRSAPEWFAEGNRCLDRREYAAAIRAFDSALAAGYDEATICRQRSRAHLERHQYPLAAADLSRLIALRGQELEGYLLRGECYLSAGLIEEAIVDFSHAVRIDAQSARVYVGRGRACLAKGEYDLALLCFDKALKRDPRSADAFRYRGETWLLRGDAEQAFKEFTAGMRVRPDDPSLFAARGEACVRQDRADQAIADFTEAIRIDWTYAPAHHGRGRMFKELGEWIDALMDLNQTLRLDRRNAAAYHDRAQVRSHLGKQAAALRDYGRFIQLTPGDPRPYVDRALFSSRQGHLNRALADFTKALRLDRSYAVAFAGRGAALRAKGKPKLAVRDFTRMLALRPDSVEVRLERGWAYLDLKMYRRARKDAREVLRREPNNAQARKLRSEIERAKKTK